MNKKVKRFWYLLNYQDLLTKAELNEMYDLYDELYDTFSEQDLQYIEMVM